MTAEQLTLAEKELCDLSNLTEELQIHCVSCGVSGLPKLVQNDSAKGKLWAQSTIPIGLPPVNQILKDETEELLISPKDLPLNTFHKSSRFWEREKNISSLYNANILPCATELRMDQDWQLETSKGNMIREVVDPDIKLTSRNTLSLKRKPGAHTDSVKGEPMNCPFWPGGKDIVSIIDKECIESNTLCFDETQYLTKPPGFSFSVTFEDKKLNVPTSGQVNEQDASLKNVKAKNLMNIADFLQVGDDFSHLFIDVCENEVEINKSSDDAPVDTTYVVKEEILESVLEKNTDTIAMPHEKEKPIEAKSWSILDDSTDMSDFHRKIPDMAFKYPFELDVFQKRAILHLEHHENVLVAAHTSAGKTVVAEYAIALSQKHMRRAIYTSPIKALSNQKFRDFRDTFPEVGLLTGDVQIKPESSCLIMTTEILRSMLYNGSDVIRDVEWVIFDEIHYINDVDRGVVWEEVLIMLPSHVGIILLSATVPNTLEFASWIGKTKQKEVYVVQTSKRPVPLEHYLFTGNSNKTSTELFCILDKKGKFLSEGYRAALNAKKERASKADESYGPRGSRQGNPKQDRSVWNSVVNMLKKKEQLPCVAFTLSKQKCDTNADMVKNMGLTTSTEESHITTFFNRSISKLKGSDQNLPQVLWMGELLKHGIGVHHSGILPILKEVVEMLFQRGLVKILFATETFAMGVNMPARTVVFNSTRKFDGVNYRDLLSSEYIQMAGRAGRRGLDATGMVIVLCKGDVPETSQLHKMMMGTPTKLVSQFRLTYFMILNLLRVKQLTVQDMMKRSFSEYYLQRDSPENTKKLESLQQKMKSMREPDCSICSVDLKDYCVAWIETYQLKKDINSYIMSSINGQKALVTGRVILVSNKNHKNALGVILQTGGLDSTKFSSSSRDPLCKMFSVLILCSKDYEEEQKRLGYQTEDRGENDIQSFQDATFDNSEAVFLPQGPCGQVVEEIVSSEICVMLNQTIKIDGKKVIDDHKKRLIPRFKFDAPSQSIIIAGQELLNLAYKFRSSELPILHPIKNLNIADLDFVQKFQLVKIKEEKLLQFSCLSCPLIKEHFSLSYANMELCKNVAVLKHHLSDESLELLTEYKQRIEVLKELNYIDNERNLRHKGRVAFEISTHEVMITELLINNILTDLDPAEVVSVLSSFVFEQRHTAQPTVTLNLQHAIEAFKETAKHVAIIEKEKGLDTTIEDVVGQLHFGLVEVVYEWAKGMSFKDVMNLTDVSEGNIVRCIQRLDEVCRDVRKAAHVIGVESLCDKMEQGMSLVRRDIVFAASLYTS